MIRPAIPVLVVVLSLSTLGCRGGEKTPSQTTEARGPAPRAIEERPSTGRAGRVLDAIPSRPDPDGYYLVYVHGAILEGAGRLPRHPRFGYYEFDAILEALADRGFVVFGEHRQRRVAPGAYAQRTVSIARRLVDLGVPPHHVAVAGFSKGGLITLVAASADDAPPVSWAVLAGCFDGVDPGASSARGRILSIYDASDSTVGSCEPFVAEGAELQEVVLETGDEHGAFFRPDDAWVDPLVEWVLAARASDPGSGIGAGSAESSP